MVVLPDDSELDPILSVFNIMQVSNIDFELGVRNLKLHFIVDSFRPMIEIHFFGGKKVSVFIGTSNNEFTRKRCGGLLGLHADCHSSIHRFRKDVCSRVRGTINQLSEINCVNRLYHKSIVCRLYVILIEINL